MRLGRATSRMGLTVNAQLFGDCGFIPEPTRIV
jgi:hypothetical protein